MKHVFFTLFALLCGAVLIYVGIRIFCLPHRSTVILFYMLRVGAIPIPIPIGIFKSPHFWGILICIVGFLVALSGLGQTKK